MWMNAVMNAVKLPNGLRLPYIERGDPAGLPVILLHGLTDSCRSYEPVLAQLPPAIRAIAVTQRGHGDADRPAAGYRPEDFAADAAALLDALGIERAVIAGHSMGAAVAQQFTIDYPERALGLVLMAAFAGFRGNPGVEELWSVVSDMSDPVAPEFVREFQAATLAAAVPPEFFETIVAESLKVPARVWKAATKALLDSDALLTAERTGIAAATLIVWGEFDAFVPRADQDALLAAIPGSRLIVVPGAGHGFHWEQSARFAADLAAFVAEIAREQTVKTPRRTGR
jgi:non-heme chloroperoxidase